MVGNAGLLVSEVIYVKKGHDREFLILDAAMNDLLRPALYEAYHDIVPIVKSRLKHKDAVYDIVGPVCETGDTFAKSREMNKCKPGDLLAFRSAGAYGAAMASEYNTRPLVPEVLTNNGDYVIIKVSFNLSPGEKVAIVGKSGAGKSTLIDLILGFYKPDKGKIEIGSIDISSILPVDLKSHIAFISQDVFLFDDTIEENIKDGFSDASKAEINIAVKNARQLDIQ